MSVFITINLDRYDLSTLETLLEAGVITVEELTKSEAWLHRHDQVDAEE